MTLSDLSSIGSLVSGIAVLVSLIYLSLQVRQAERNQRALMNQGVVNRLTDINMWQAQPDICSLNARVALGETDFSAPEIMHLTARLRVNLLSIQDTYVQHKAGLVDQITFDTLQPALKNAMATPVFRAIWKSARTAYSPEWQSFVDKVIADTPLREPVDVVARFKADLAAVMR
jgi:hypothetical protein